MSWLQRHPWKGCQSSHQGHHGSHRCKLNHPSPRRTTTCPQAPCGGSCGPLISPLPISAKLAQKIISQQYVAMKELLSDNIALHSQLDDLPAQTALAAHPHRLREIESPLSWVFCFLAYIAVRTSDRETRDMLTYARLVIREAQCHGGGGGGVRLA